MIPSHTEVCAHHCLLIQRRILTVQKAGEVESHGLRANCQASLKEFNLQPEKKPSIVSQIRWNLREVARLDKFALNSFAAGPIFGIQTGDEPRCLIGADLFCQ